MSTENTVICNQTVLVGKVGKNDLLMQLLHHIMHLVYIQLLAFLSHYLVEKVFCRKRDRDSLLHFLPPVMVLFTCGDRGFSKS